MNGFAATFSDFKLVKTRSVAQIVLEVPLEQADAALASLGGLPSFKDERWVAVAPMVAEPRAKPEKKPKSRAEMAGILCNDPRFTDFLSEFIAPDNEDLSVTNLEWTAARVREYCGVKSRAELNTDPAAAAKWEELMNGFNAYTGRSGAP